MRIKNLSNLYVLAIEEVINTLQSNAFQLEEGMTRPNCICQREENSKEEILYRDLEKDKVYSTKDVLGEDRVDITTIVPLENYYNFLGMRRKNNYSNQKVVHQKVKLLKRQRKI